MREVVYGAVLEEDAEKVMQEREHMEITRLDSRNFTLDSLDNFSRHQEVTQVYRLIDGQLQLVPLTFTEDWSLERRREKAREILRGQHIVCGAIDRGEVVGVIMLRPALDHGRMVIDSFHVSANHRRNGIGRALFEAAKAEAIRRGANALYASACSARETIDFYRAMGFNVSPNPIPACVAEEPCDIQMECNV